MQGARGGARAHLHGWEVSQLEGQFDRGPEDRLSDSSVLVPTRIIARRSENGGQWIYLHIPSPLAALRSKSRCRPPAQLWTRRRPACGLCCVVWSSASHLGMRRRGRRCPPPQGLLDSGVGALPGCDFSACGAATDCSCRRGVLCRRPADRGVT